MNTEQLAAALQIKPESIHKRHYLTGAYFCLRPVKMPNRRLVWPEDSIAQLSGYEASGADAMEGAAQ